MPTTTIETTVADPRFRRRIAKELSFWWRRQGTDINHVITRFVPLPGETVYSGPFPLDGPPGAPTRPDALVAGVLAAGRGPQFRRAYAFAVRAALGPEVPPDRVFVSFQPTDPADHFTPGSPAWDGGPEAVTAEEAHR
ncbi:hypothetical protein ACFQ0D_32715 [Micromonospora zhanjiangensis]